MNFKEKWSKQNNSIKLLLRKLKRHDTVVVAIAVVIAMILCGGLIYLSTPVVTATAKEELEQSERANNDKTIEKLDELGEYLNGLDKSITDSKDNISEFYAKNDEDKLESQKNTESMTHTVTDKVTLLGNNLDTIHETITNTENNIEKLKEIIEKNDEDSSSKVKDGFSQITTELDSIQKQYTSAQESTGNLINELQSAMKDGNSEMSKELQDKYKDLLNKLTESNAELTEQNNNTLEQFKTEITNLNIEINNKLDTLSSNMDKGLGDLDENVSKGFNEQNTNINNQFGNMNLLLEGDMGALREYIGTEVGNVNSKLEQVFQRVSNGKKLLASALLTKNITVREDATFAEFAKAIEDIPVQIVLDNGDVAGSIEYDYHFHHDGNGEECNEDVVSIDRQGGCYTEPVYHKHTEECYQTSYTYRYLTSNSVEHRGHGGYDLNGEELHRWHCNYCNSDFTNHDAGHAEFTNDRNVVSMRNGWLEATYENKTLVCGKNEGTLVGYRTGCGLVHGQVIAARITFADEYSNYNTVKENATSSDSLKVSNVVNTEGSKLIYENMDFFNGFLDVTAGNNNESTGSTQKESSENSQQTDKSEDTTTEKDKESKDVTAPDAASESGSSTDTGEAPTKSEVTNSKENGSGNNGTSSGDQDNDIKEDSALESNENSSAESSENSTLGSGENSGTEGES